MSAGASSGGKNMEQRSRILVKEILKEFTFGDDKRTKKRFHLTVGKLNDHPRVMISSFWFCEGLNDKNKWIPCKKGHCTMSPEQWRDLAVRVPAITRAVRQLERKIKMNYDGAISGM
jgi:hypothetical protein